MSLSLDIKYAARLLAKKPKFTLLMVAIVAIGLGLTLYTFSVLNHLLFDPLRFNDDEPVFAVEALYDHTHLERRRAMALDLYRLQQDTSLFKDMGFYLEQATFVGGMGEGLRKFNSSAVSWNLFRFTGVQPILGRALLPDDHLEGAERVLVLGYDVWQSYFNGSQDVIGQIVPIDGADSARIVGVMPKGFAFPLMAQMWQPLPQAAMMPTKRSPTRHFAFAKLADGVSLQQAQSRLDSISKEIDKELTGRYRQVLHEGRYLSIEPFKKAALTEYYGMFIALFIVSVLILLLACINVGNLLLARVNERIKEVAVRVALGIPQHRLILQMLWESVFIAVIGGFLAILLAGWGLDVTNHVFDQVYEIDQLKPFWWTLGLDAQALFVLICSMLTMIVITGFIPAWRSLHGDFNAVLRDGTRGALGKRAAKATKVLVIAEIVLSCVVLILATVLLVSSYSAGVADYGVETDKRITAQIRLTPTDYKIRRDPEFRAQDILAQVKFYADLKSELESRNNVIGVALMSQLPGSGEGTSYFEIQGREAVVWNENPYTNNERAAPGAFSALGMTLLQGRDFDHRDRVANASTVIINESIARDFFPNGDAVGQKVRIVRENSPPDAPWNTIIGVVSDSFHGNAMEFSSASYNSYHPLAKLGMTHGMVALHYSGSEAQARQTLYDAVNVVNANVGVFHVQSYDALIQKPMMLISAVSEIFLLCGVIAAFLAASGIYAVSANSVHQRTQEIGVRRALGALDGQIIRLVIGQASWQLVAGLIFGIALSVWLIGLMSDTMIFSTNSYLFGIFGMPLLIALMVLFATYTPVKRVLKREPSDALHQN